jgi:hypothetical protein
MPDNFYIETVQSGTSLTIYLFATAGAEVESADVSVTWDPAAASFNMSSAPQDWLQSVNTSGDGVATVSMIDGGSNPVGSSSDGLLLTVNLILVSSAETASGAVTVTDYSNTSGSTFNIAQGPYNYDVVACFASGTKILTPHGELAVEELTAGDIVVTMLDGKTAPVRWTGFRNVEFPRNRARSLSLPVRIARSAFGPDMPRQDIRLSPDHSVFVNGSLVPIRYLLNDATVIQETVDAIAYWHVELERHSVIFAEGLPCESYLDTGNRGAFSNGGGVTLIRPSFALETWNSAACAPLVVNGPKLAEIRSLLLGRAAGLGWSLVRNAEPCIQMGSQLLVPQVEGALHRFRISGVADEIHLMSRCWIPARASSESDDHRRLGVAVSRIVADGRTVELDDERLTTGWHAVEYADDVPRWRWTDGNAILALGRTSILDIEIAITGSYWLSPKESRSAAA